MWLVVWNFGAGWRGSETPNKCLCLLISDKDLLKIQKLPLSEVDMRE